ncbi:MAG TPA: hydrogenase/urease maturation nickel metallochaperone HypA [Candidatus Limnocylindrales bacterium]|nr:hydrogenase/urease maturation nickel metallochaperone HypA [Candidatus Limnocylindrales bacterium]
MHEAAIAERIVEAALAAAGERAAAVTAVELEAGPDAPMSAEALRFHWTEAVRGTRIEGAALRIVEVAEPRALRLVALDVGP